jgi:hypothetical protein
MNNVAPLTGICDICETTADANAHVETHDIHGAEFAVPSVICTDCWANRPGRFAIEIRMSDEDGWLACETDGERAEFGSIADAEAEACFSLADDVQWRVVEIGQ